MMSRLMIKIDIKKGGIFMSKEYNPTITEGYYPEDAGWSLDESSPILLLYLPELSKILGQKFHSFDFAWLYNESLNAYIFCFKINNQEYAIIFERDHAGMLLLESEAEDSFAIAITDIPFEEINENTNYLLLPNIHLKRHIKENW